MRTHYRQQGFSLVEMVITVAIVAVISVVSANFVINGLTVQRYTSEQNEAIAQSRNALKTMAGELREMVPSDTGAYPIELVDEQELIFYSDVDNDTYTERIRYILNGTNLQRGIVEPSGDPLSYNPADETFTTFSIYIQNDTLPVFYYYNEDFPQDTENNPLSHPVDTSQIRMIQMNVFTNVDINRIPETRELLTAVQLRNLKENYE